MGIEGEIAVKEERIRRLMEIEKYDAVVFSTNANFAWFTCGGDNHVSIASEAGVASAVLTKYAKYIVTSNIESRRIMEEEVKGQGFVLLESPWHQGGMADGIIKLTSGMNAVSDNGIVGLPAISERIAELRWYLTPEEIDRYRILGKHTEEVMNKVCKSLKPGITENEVAGRLADELLSKGITPIVLLIAADERIDNYRHPVNTGKKIKRYVMNVVCARKWGLIISCTRLVHFGAISVELRKKHDAVVKIDAALNLGTETGRSLSEILNDAIKEYRDSGYPEEWKLHHQGGPTGYSARELVATPSEMRKVSSNQAFAWNPSITGTKSEDTVLLTQNGIEWLSISTDWPMLEVEYKGIKAKREDILVI